MEDRVGELYACGRRILTEGQWLSPISFYASLPIVQVSCGDSHGVALTNEGQVMTWGVNSYGQLGLANVAHDVEMTPRLIESLVNDNIIVNYVCAGNR